MAESSPRPDIGSLNTGSEFTFDIECFTCNSDGQIQEAEGYCLDCCEHLCTTCLKYHRISSATKHHKLTDKEHMPGKQSISSARDICTERCQIHKDDIIKFFCTTHKVLGCSVCVTLQHKLCNDVAYIPEEATHLNDCQEFMDFQSKLEKLIKRSEYISKATKSNVKLSDEYRTKALQEIETYRQELNDAFDKLKKELEKQSEDITAREAERMNSVADTNNQLLEELHRISVTIKELLDKKQHCQLFIDMKNAEDKLIDIHDRLPKEEDIFVTAVRFQPNLELQKLIQKKYALGKLLVKHPYLMEATFSTDINVKSPGSVGVCRVRSEALLSESRLVITDLNSKSVKLIDIERNEILSEYNTEQTPFMVTAVGKIQIAVTFPEAKKIEILRSENDLNLDEEIIFNANCWCVACVDDKLVVSFSDPWEVRIVNMAGEVLQTFASSSHGDRLFSRAPGLSVSSFNKAIYASDWNENRVTMLDMVGNVRAVYEDSDLKHADETAVDNTGMVYLCGRDSNNIHLLTPDCRKVKILLSERDGIKESLSICYCKVTHKLYIGMHNNDNIKVFQLSQTII